MAWLNSAVINEDLHKKFGTIKDLKSDSSQR